MAFSPDDAWLVTSTGEEYRFWRTDTWEPAYRVTREGGGDHPGAMAFSADGTMLALAFSRCVVRIVNPGTGSEIATLDPSELEEVYDFSFSADAGQLAVASSMAGVRVWNLRLIRQHLAAMQLDWSLPQGSPSRLPPQESDVFRVRVLTQP